MYLLKLPVVVQLVGTQSLNRLKKRNESIENVLSLLHARLILLSDMECLHVLLYCSVVSEGFLWSSHHAQPIIT